MKVVYVVFVAMMLLVSGCASVTKNLGNGRIDPVEAAVIRVSVGVAIVALPGAALPAYMVSKGLLATIGNNRAAFTGNVDILIGAEVEKLKFDQQTKSVFGDFVALVKADIQERVASVCIDKCATFIVLRQFLEIIRDTTGQHLGVAAIHSA